MSAVKRAKLKANCDAVNSGQFIINQPISTNRQTVNSKATENANHGAKLSQKQNQVDIKEKKSPLQSIAQTKTTNENFQFQSQKFSSDVQKVLKREQELQKQLYSGSNVAPGWLRVNHHNKVIYISPSGIGLASLKQVKDYLLTRGTCKCGLPFPLRVELFFNFNTEVPTVPLKTPIESIKFDPTCKHRKRLTTSQQANNSAVLDSNRSRLNSTTERSSEECLLPSFVSSATSKIGNHSANSTVMIMNSGNTLATKPQQVTFQQQQRQFLQHDPPTNANMVMRIVREDNDSDGSKLPPWKKNSMVHQGQANFKGIQQTQMVSSGIPIFQINGQNVIALDQNIHMPSASIQKPQQIQIIDQKGDGIESWLQSDGKGGGTIIRRRPTFKEDPTGYLNQQTALLHNTITTLHSPDGSSSTNSSASPALRESSDNSQRAQIGQRQFIQQYVKASPGQVTSIGGQTLTHMPNGIVQIQQNCDIKPQQKPMMIQEQNKFIRQNPKGRPPKNPQTIAKRLVAMAQESPVSSTSAGNVIKLTKSTTPDISSSSHTPEAIAEIVQTSAEFVKFARSSSSQENRTSTTQVIAGKAITHTTTSAGKSPATMAMNKSQTMIGQLKPGNLMAQNTSNQQILMTSNGQQFIVMPSQNMQQQHQQQNIMLHSNSLMQLQNSNNQRLIQGQGGNFLIQTSTGNVISSNQLHHSQPMTSGGNFVLSNGQQLNPLIIQNGQIIQNGNILLSSGSAGKTIISGNNQLSSPILSQQTVLLNGIPTQTIVQDSSFMQNNQQQLTRAITTNSEKKKGRKRKIPLSESQQMMNQPTTIQTTPQSGLIQMSPQSFQLSSQNILVQNKMGQSQQNQQIILQNGQTLIQQPMNLIGSQQLMLPSGQFPVMMTQDGNSIVQLQNPTFNNVIQTQQGMMIRAPMPQQQQTQKTFITSNGQQYIVNQAGQQSQMNQVFNSPMGFIVQAQQPNQGHQMMNQPQIVTQTSGMGQGTMIGQQTQYITQSDGKISNQRKIIHQKVQHQKFYPQMMKPPRTEYGTVKNPIQTIVQEIEQPEEEDEETPENSDTEEICEEIEQELSFEDDKPDMIQELNHGSQQVLHHSMEGQCGIMNIDDITIEMDEINDLNEYLNAIDEEDNRMAQIGLSSLQQFANSPPDTTTHSPRSPINTSSEKSNGSSDSTNMVQFVSSSEPDSNSNVSPVDCQMSPPQHQSHYSGNHQPLFKLPMDPKAIMKSPLMGQMQLHNYGVMSQKNPSMRPDSHESASPDQEVDLPGVEIPVEEDSAGKSDFDLLKESPPVNTIKLPVPVDIPVPPASQVYPSPTTSIAVDNQTRSNFMMHDLIWGATRGCDAWPGKIVIGPDGEPTPSDCVWVKWFGGRQNTEMMPCSTLKSLSEGLEAHHAAQKDTRKGRKLNSHLERAIQKAMTELDKHSNAKKGNSDKKAVTSSHKSPKVKLVKIAPAPDKK